MPYALQAGMNGNRQIVLDRCLVERVIVDMTQRKWRATGGEYLNHPRMSAQPVNLLHGQLDIAQGNRDRREIAVICREPVFDKHRIDRTQRLGRVMSFRRDTVFHRFHRVQDGVVDVVHIQELACHRQRMAFNPLAVAGDGIAAHDPIGVPVVGVSGPMIAPGIAALPGFRQKIEHTLMIGDRMQVAINDTFGVGAGGCHQFISR